MRWRGSAIWAGSGFGREARASWPAGLGCSPLAGCIHRGLWQRGPARPRVPAPSPVACSSCPWPKSQRKGPGYGACATRSREGLRAIPVAELAEPGHASRDAVGSQPIVGQPETREHRARPRTPTPDRSNHFRHSRRCSSELLAEALAAKASRPMAKVISRLLINPSCDLCALLEAREGALFDEPPEAAGVPFISTVGARRWALAKAGLGHRSLPTWGRLTMNMDKIEE